MVNNFNSINNRVFLRISGRGRGFVFNQANFLDLGSRDAVDQVMSRGARAGKIRKLARGLYDYPQLSKKDKKQLLRDVRYAPSWVGDVMCRVASEESQ